MKSRHDLTVAIRIVCLLGLLFATGACSWSNPPRSSDALGPSYSLRDPLFDRTMGEVFLMPEGLWAWVPESAGGTTDAFEVGQLALFQPVQDPAHVFAVVLKRPWGLLLQRLDTRPLRAESRGAMNPLGTGAPNQDRPAICRGIGDDPRAMECLSETPTARWNVYGAHDGLSRLVIRETQDKDPLLPAGRLGQFLSVGAEPPQWFGGHSRPEGAWVAIADEGQGASPPMIRAATLACPALTSAQSLLELEVLSDWKVIDHPLHIEGAAFEHGVDLLARCTDADIVLFIPTLHRPMIGIREQRLGAPVISRRPLRIEKAPSAAYLSTLQMGARVAAGDFGGADLWMEHLLEVLPNSSSRDRLALLSMQIGAAAGRPEAAMRAGHFGSRTTWNRDNDKAWHLGLVSVFRQLEMHHEAHLRIQSLLDLNRRDRDEEWRTWHLWSELRLKRLQGKSLQLRELDEAVTKAEAEDLDDWALVLKTMAFQERAGKTNLEEAQRVIEAAYEKADLLPLWKAYLGDGLPRACVASSTERCAMDPYGRHLLDLLNEPNTSAHRLVGLLEEAPVIDFRPGFSADILLTIGQDERITTSSIDLAMAIFPLLDVHGRHKIVDIVTTSLSEGLAEGSDGELCQTREAMGNRMNRTVARAAPTFSTREDRHQGRTLIWLTTAALDAACRGVPELLEAIEARAEAHPREAGAALAMVDARLLDPSTDALSAEILHAASLLAARYGEGGFCRQWSLAMALAYITTGHLELAEAMLIHTGSCPKGADGDDSSRALLQAYLQYEKTGSLTAISTPKERDQLARLSSRQPSANECIGLRPLTFQIETHVDPAIAALSKRIHLPPPPKASLQLRTYSATVGMAEANFLTARRTLAQGRVPNAARALLAARAEWKSIDHRAGLARIAFLEEVVFDGDLEAHARGDSTWRDDASSSGAGALRRGKARQLLMDSDGIGSEDPTMIRILAAAAILVEDDLAMRTRLETQSREPALSTLCQVSDDGGKVVPPEAP